MDAALGLFERMGEKYKVEIVKDIAAEGANPHALSPRRLGGLLPRAARPIDETHRRREAPQRRRRVLAGRREERDAPAHLRHRLLRQEGARGALTKLEEVKKRDHRKLGPALGLFAFHEVAPGAAFWLPNGTTLYNVLEDAMRRLVTKGGYQEVKTPLLFNKRLWEQSGHWGVYRENMFLVFDKEADPALPVDDRLSMSLKPMNCPSHHLIYKMGKRSYRELPIRYFTVDTLHRNELSGSLGGLTRVRQFAQDDAHIYLMESQIPEETSRIVELMKTVYGAFGLEFSLLFSTRPVSRRTASATMRSGTRRRRAPRRARQDRPALGAERRRRRVLRPKIDFVVTDSLGRKWQTCTIQLDYAAPERFDLTYVGDDNHEHRPVVIHRAVYGSFERFIAILTEHYAGAFRPGSRRCRRGS